MALHQSLFTPQQGSRTSKAANNTSSLMKRSGSYEVRSCKNRTFNF